jgi:hypothetical protein
MCCGSWLIKVVLAAKREAEPLHDKEAISMRLTLAVRQDIRRLVAVFGVSLAFIVAQTAPALAAGSDPDSDGLRSSIERNVTETNPRDADTDNDRIKDGNEDEDWDGVDNTNELSLETDLDDDDSDDDDLEDGDEDEDSAGVEDYDDNDDDEDEDD